MEAHHRLVERPDSRRPNIRQATCIDDCQLQGVIFIDYYISYITSIQPNRNIWLLQLPIVL